MHYQETIVIGPKPFDVKAHCLKNFDSGDYEVNAHIEENAGISTGKKKAIEFVFTAKESQEPTREFVVAYLLAYRQQRSLEIQLLATQGHYWGMGLASSLLRCVAETFLAKQPLDFEAIHNPVPEAVPFYRKLGFRRTSKDYMALELSDANLRQMRFWRPHVRQGFKLGSAGLF